MEHELISAPTYEVLRRDLDQRAEEAEKKIAEIYAQDESRAAEEMRTAKRRLIAAEKSAIEKSLRDGLISAGAAAKLSEEVAHRLDQLAAERPRKIVGRNKDTKFRSREPARFAG